MTPNLDFSELLAAITGYAKEVFGIASSALNECVEALGPATNVRPIKLNCEPEGAYLLLDIEREQGNVQRQFLLCYLPPHLLPVD